MKLWTLLIITYGAGQFDGTVSYVAVPSQQACEQIMSGLFDALQAVQPDVMVQCQETDSPSWIDGVPLMRPEDME